MLLILSRFAAVEILFSSNISMIKQESLWQRVRYYLEVGPNSDFLEIKWIYESRRQDLHIERYKRFLYIVR